MSKRLLKEQPFLELLLTTYKAQAKALTESITLNQVEVIIEILTNLQKLKVPQSTKVLLQKRKKVLTSLTNTRTKLSTKLRIARKHFRQIIDTLLSVKKQLIQLLK